MRFEVMRQLLQQPGFDELALFDVLLHSLSPAQANDLKRAAVRACFRHPHFFGIEDTEASPDTRAPGEVNKPLRLVGSWK